VSRSDKAISAMTHRHPTTNSLTKVPEITGAFWVTKVATTAMGESTSDALNQHPGPYLAAPPMLVGLGLALVLQFRMTGPTSVALALLIAVLVGYLATTRNGTRLERPPSAGQLHLQLAELEPEIN
jgi:uncharacterized membrane-anchored protein